MTTHEPIDISSRTSLRRITHRIREVIGDYEVLLPVVLAMTPEGAAERAISTRTELVIDGFFRCGNTFAATAFRQAQPKPVRLSTHVHVPASISRAVRLGIPTLVCVRPPLDCVASFLVASPHLPPARAVRDYVHFYDRVLPLAEHFVVGLFEEVTADFGAVTNRLNSKFGTSFVPFDHTPANVGRAFRSIEERNAKLHPVTVRDRFLPRPSSERHDRSEAAKAQLQSARLRTVINEADAVYASLVAAAKSAGSS